MRVQLNTVICKYWIEWLTRHDFQLLIPAMIILNYRGNTLKWKWFRITNKFIFELWTVIPTEIMSMTAKDLRFTLFIANKLAKFYFMDTGIKHKMPELRIGNCITHSTISSIIISIFVLFLAWSSTRATEISPDWCLLIQWVAFQRNHWASRTWIFL